MKQYHHFQTLLFATLFTLQTLIPQSAGSCGTSSAVVSALLPLHSGADCSSLELRGLQQLAALRAVINQVNNDLKAQDGLTLGLLVQDTCSSPEGAMRAAMRSLVDVQQTCSNPPLYLGMVGPEDAESLTKAKGVSRVFNATHVMPFFHKESEDDSVFQVSIERSKEQAQSVLAVLKQLNWHSFSLAFEESMEEVAEVLISSAKEDTTVCVQGSVARLNLQTPVPNIFVGNQDGVVVLVDSHQVAARVLQSYQALSVPVVMLVRKIGLEAWQVPRTATNLHLIQQVSVTVEDVPETMNTTLKQQYDTQRQTEFQTVHCKNPLNALDCALETSSQDHLFDNIDMSVTPMANAIRLIGTALRSVHRTHCLTGNTPTFGMCPKLMALSAAEWRNALRRATAATKAADNQRIRFLMELPTHFEIFSRGNTAGDLIKVASLAGGAVKEVIEGYTFPAKEHTANSIVCGQAPSVLIPPPLKPLLTPPVAPAKVPVYEENPTLKDIYTSEYSFYELVGMICGVGFIMFGVMVAMIYLIYNNLVEKTEKESTAGSLETVRSTRPARKNFRDTFRRNSVTRSSTHS